MVSILMIASCNDRPTDKDIQITPQSEIVKTSLSDNLQCWDDDYQIYLETAVLWQDSWTSVYQESGLSDSPKLFFGLSDLEALELKANGSKGVRILYILPSENPNDTIPSLAIVNIEDGTCSAVSDCLDSKCALVSRYDEGRQYFEDYSIVQTYQQRWIDHSNKLMIHTPVYGYNYSWNKIMSSVDKEASGPGIWVKYGMRTLGPYDSEEYTEENPGNITGSIVYCNIVYGEDPANSTQELFDFAKPCPIYCDPQ